MKTKYWRTYMLTLFALTASIAKWSSDRQIEGFYSSFTVVVYSRSSDRQIKRFHSTCSFNFRLRLSDLFVPYSKNVVSNNLLILFL